MTVLQMDDIGMLESKEERTEGETEKVLSTVATAMEGKPPLHQATEQEELECVLVARILQK